MGLFDFLKKKPAAAQSGDPQLERRVQALVGELKAPSADQRRRAAQELRDLGLRAVAAQAALEEATSDDDNEVCTAAAEALAAIRRALDEAQH